MSERTFTVMRSQWHWEDRHLIESCPASIPWAMIAPHEPHAQRNHYQSLETLNRRGGLSPQELYYVMRGERWPWQTSPIPMATAVDWLRKLIEAQHA